MSDVPHASEYAVADWPAGDDFLQEQLASSSKQRLTEPSGVKIYKTSLINTRFTIGGIGGNGSTANLMEKVSSTREATTKTSTMREISIENQMDVERSSSTKVNLFMREKSEKAEPREGGNS